MAKNRYGWNKRVKEIARKLKSEEKMKRRQGKSQAKPAAVEDTEPGEQEGNAPDSPAPGRDDAWTQ